MEISQESHGPRTKSADVNIDDGQMRPIWKDADYDSIIGGQRPRTTRRIINVKWNRVKAKCRTCMMHHCKSRTVLRTDHVDDPPNIIINRSRFSPSKRREIVYR